MSFLGFKGKTFLVVGIANRKSVAWSVAKLLEDEGANIIYSVRSKKRESEPPGPLWARHAAPELGRDGTAPPFAAFLASADTATRREKGRPCRNW